MAHIEERLGLLCRKSEDLALLLSTSIRSWNVDHVTRLLGIETQDLPLLMAGCSVHSPSVARMGGVTILWWLPIFSLISFFFFCPVSYKIAISVFLFHNQPR